MAWSIRARSALRPRANPAFPAWAWPVIAVAIADGTALAAASRQPAGLGLQL